MLEPTIDEGSLTGDPLEALVRPAVLEALGVAVYTTDASGVLTSFNEAAVAFWGRRPVLGDDKWFDAWRVYHLDGRPMPHDDCPMGVALREKRRVWGVNAIAERRDGVRRWFVSYPTPFCDPAGNLLGAVDVLVDTTDSREAGDAAAYLNAIITSSDDAVVSKSLDGTVTSWNAGAERIFGFTAEEMVGRSIRTIIPQDRQAEEDEVLARVRRGERVDHYETWRLRKDGSQFPISLTVSPVHDRHGRIIGASKIARDITDRYEADRKIADALAIKDEFIGLISHEMRTPLTMILGNASILARGAPGADASVREQASSDIYREAMRLNSIIDDMLSLARVERADITAEPVALGRAVEKVVKEHAATSPRRITLQLHSETPIVSADEAVIFHVVGNYLSNAEKYSALESPIEIEVDGDGSVRVCDRGIGIDPTEAERLFESFYRSSNVGQVGGVGIGLSVCRRLVEAFGGTVWAIPREGGGSEFGFRLPPYGSTTDES